MECCVDTYSTLMIASLSDYLILSSRRVGVIDVGADLLFSTKSASRPLGIPKVDIFHVIQLSQYRTN